MVTTEKKVDKKEKLQAKAKVLKKKVTRKNGNKKVKEDHKKEENKKEERKKDVHKKDVVLRILKFIVTLGRWKKNLQ